MRRHDRSEPLTGPLHIAVDSAVERVADGVVAVVNENMASAARVHVAEGGHDAEKFALLVTGGGGPLHGCDVARRLGIDRVICPPGAGVASALGLLIAPARIDRVRSIARQLRDIGVGELEAAFAALEQDAAQVMRETLGDDGAFSFERSADLRFVGQGFEIVTRLPPGPFDATTPARIIAEFKDGYARIFAHVPPVDGVEIINLRLAAIEKAADRPLRLTRSKTEAWSIGSGSRDVWDGSVGAWRRLKVIAREALETGQELVGPIVVEDASSTLLIPDGARARRDASGNIVVDLKRARVAEGESVDYANSRASARLTASGSLSMTTRSTRAGPSGRLRCCSQSRSVPGGMPNRCANSVWLSRSLVRMAFTSISMGTCTRQVEGSALPRAIARASFAAWISRLPSLLMIYSVSTVRLLHSYTALPYGSPNPATLAIL